MYVILSYNKRLLNERFRVKFVALQYTEQVSTTVYDYFNVYRTTSTTIAMTTPTPTAKQQFCNNIKHAVIRPNSQRASTTRPRDDNIRLDPSDFEYDEAKSFLFRAAPDITGRFIIFKGFFFLYYYYYFTSPNTF